MSIWGRRDGEPPAEEYGSRAEARGGQAEAQDTQEPAAEHQAGEPAPAFWRAQGQTPAPPGRDPAGAPRTRYAIDGETAVKDPALTGTAGEQAGTHDADAGPAVTEIQEPTMAVA